MRYRRITILALFPLVLVLAAKKKNPDGATQTLDLPKDPPMVAQGETRRLVFHVSPLSATGLLSQQVRDALKAVLKATGGAPMIHIRAFVAGSGDLRRVPQIVGEVFGEKKQLPSVSVMQVGALPLENAQVVLETVSVAKRDVNPDGLMFIPAQPADSVAKSLDRLSARLGSAMPLRVTCFVSEIGGEAGTIAARYPSAAIDVVQMQRTPSKSEASCEAVADGGIVVAKKIAFTGTQVAFGSDEKAASLAFERMDRALHDAGVDPAGIVLTRIYPISPRMGELAQKALPPKSVAAVIPVEGVAATDGSFAIDSIAAIAGGN